MTKAPNTITFAILSFREIVRIALKIATLRDLAVKLGNILNVYVQAPATEKVWTTLGPEFGNNASKTVVIVRAFYGQNLTGASFRGHLAR